jgi:hypothetical protein
VLSLIVPLKSAPLHWQLRTLSAVRRCRTSALGGHIDMVVHVGTSASAITPVANTVPNVGVKQIGYKLDKASFTSTLFSCGFYLADSINVLPMQDPNWFMICYLSQQATLEVWEKPKVNWDDCSLQDRTCPCIHYTASYRAAGLIK